MLHISLAAEKIGHIGPMPITNSLLTTWVVMLVLLVISLLVKRSLALVPSHGQSIAEMVIEALYDFFQSVVGEHVRKLFPLIASLFFFIILANWIGLVPGVGTIGFFETHGATVEAEQAVPATETAAKTSGIEGAVHEEVVQEKIEETAVEEATFVPLLRGATADLNTTIALAIIAFGAIQYFGFQTLGFHYTKRFFNFSNPIMFFVGMLEIISDVSKVISFAFRLFGNIFAGEVLLTVMAFLMPFLAPMPFLVLELFVGFIQALVFSTLTAVFVNVAVSHEE